MKKSYILFLLFLALTGYQQRAFATHAAGMDLSFTCYGNNQYQFVATFYRDCAGIDAPFQLPLDLSSVSCNEFTTFYMDLVYSTQGSDTISHLAGLCPGLNSVCIGGSYPGYEQYIYAVTVTLPDECSDWVASTYLSARNENITNLLNPGDQNIYVECHFSNANGLCDNSPLFTTIPLAYSCIDELFFYNHGGYDPDGDSLVFELVNPLHDANTPIAYSSSSLSPTYPLFTVDGTFGFDPLTGQMSCTPNSAQFAVISVRIDEYRDGVKIGSTIRDLQVVISGCNNNVPEIPLGIENVIGGFLVDSTTVQICPGALLEFDLVGVDIDNGDELTMTSNLGITIPGASYSVSGTNPATFHFVWQTEVNDTGTYVFTVTIKDDGCPISGQQVYSYTVQVAASDVDAGPDLLVCVTDPVVQLNVEGISPFQWNNPQYLNNSTSQTPIATLPGIGNYEFIVTAGVGSFCEFKDTVIVTVHEDFVSTVDADPDTLCAGEQVTLSSTATGGLGGYTYSWSSIPFGASGTQSSLTDNPEVSTTYILTSQSGGCIHHDTIPVYARQLPSATFALDDTLCEGQVTTVSYTGGAGTGYDYIWDWGNANVQSGTGSGPYEISYSQTGVWNITLTVTDDFGCSGTHTIPVVVNPNPFADFTSPVGGCEPFTVFFDNLSTGGTSYLWEFGDGATSTEQDPTHTYTTGVYDVSLTVTNQFGCTSSLTFDNYIEVLPVPVACGTVQEDITIVYDLSQSTFHFTDCSQNATAWHWDFGDGSSSNEQNPTHTYTVVDTFYVILTASNKYCNDTVKIGPIITVFWDEVYFPTAISPNGDSHNDFFHELGGDGITTLYYAVYNRWGELLYETNNQNDLGWDGTYKGKDCEVGVYVWISEASFINGTRISRKGNVTLVR